MAKIIFDLTVFATGLSFGVFLTSWLFHAKHKELVAEIDRELDLFANGKGIKRVEFDALEGQVSLMVKTITEHGRLLGRDEMITKKL